MSAQNHERVGIISLDFQAVLNLNKKVLSSIAKKAILLFFANNPGKVRAIIAPVIEDYKSSKITYAKAEFNARTRIYQSVKSDFNSDVEYMKEPLSRDIPAVDNSLFILARKLILESK